MRNIRIIALAASASVASGCATTSFAPRGVNLVNVIEDPGTDKGISGSCGLVQRQVAGKSVPIERDVKGAHRLIENFILVYRCDAHRAADGRRFFEVPAFLALTGTATAVAFGAGPDVAIAGGAASAILNGGKGYFDPKSKAKVYDSALDALLCIKSEAAGVDPYGIEIVKKLEDAAATARAAGAGSSVEISVDEQYFTLIYSAVLTVERVLAQRLSNTGDKFDAAGVVAEIEKLSAEQAKKEMEAPAAAAISTNALATDASNGAAATTPPLPTDVAPADVKLLSEKFASTNSLKARVKAFLANETETKAVVAKTKIYLDVLQPKIQKCVVRAKI